MTYKMISVFAAIIAFGLFLSLLLAPQLIYSLFSVTGNDSADFFTRRAAVLFLGYALISFTARNAEHSLARQAICLGLGGAMLSLAILGLSELLLGNAGLGIFVAVAGELFLGVFYLSIWFTHKKTN